jgi:hypothetical protein
MMGKSVRMAAMQSNAELKSRFETLLGNLQSEFNSMLEARQIIME